MMFTGFPTTRTTSNNTATVSSHSTSKTKRIILPITSRQAILHNSSSGYKSKRKCRVRQLHSLHNDILNDDKKWESFQLILQLKLANTGITNSTVKALLYDALDSFQSTESVDVEATATITTKDSRKIDDSPPSTTLSKINTISKTKEHTDTENDVHNKLPSKTFLMQDEYHKKHSLSFMYNPAIRISSQNSAHNPTFVSKTTENAFDMMTITKEEESPWRTNVKNQQIQILLSVDSVLEETINNFSQLEAVTAPIQRRYNRPYRVRGVAA